MPSCGPDEALAHQWMESGCCLAPVGTPAETSDETHAVFGDYISFYDVQDAVDNGADAGDAGPEPSVEMTLG